MHHMVFTPDELMLIEEALKEMSFDGEIKRNLLEQIDAELNAEEIDWSDCESCKL